MSYDIHQRYVDMCKASAEDAAQLRKERDALAARLRVAQEQLDNFQGALAEQTLLVAQRTRERDEVVVQRNLHSDARDEFRTQRDALAADLARAATAIALEDAVLAKCICNDARGLGLCSRCRNLDAAIAASRHVRAERERKEKP